MRGTSLLPGKSREKKGMIKNRVLTLSPGGEGEGKLMRRERPGEESNLDVLGIEGEETPKNPLLERSTT